MDLENAVIKRCLQGTEAEYQGRLADAKALYWQAWEMAGDDYEACIAAHYVARHQATARETFRWNREALDRADAVTAASAATGGDNRVTAFYPSLYLNIGRAHELLGEMPEAERYYELAAALGAPHQE